MKEEKLYWIGFSAFPGIGPKRFALLRKYFGSAKKAWQAPEEKLLKTGLNQKLVGQFLQFRQETNLASLFLRLKNLGIKTITAEEKNYPNNLRCIYNAPFVIYIKGQLKPRDELAIAVVGTRKISSYGRQVTESLVTDLVAAGLTIVSGMAYDVDLLAQIPLLLLAVGRLGFGRAVWIASLLVFEKILLRKF